MKTLQINAVLAGRAAMRRVVVAAVLLGATVGLPGSVGPTQAQSGPLCSRFAEGAAGQDGWGPCPTAPNIVVTTTDVGSIGGPGDYHLHLRDTSGASAACSTDPKYKGNWVEKMGGCGQFCFDFKLFKSGTPPASVHPSISIYDAAGNRALFVANVILTSADPWEKNICAPIKLIQPGENLPSGPSGSWQIPPSGNAFNPAWNNIIQNVDRVLLPVDFTADPSEEVGYDNMCMSPAPCPGNPDPKPPEIKGCLEGSKLAVKCNGDGTYTVTLNGSGFAGTDITMTSQTAGVTVTPPQQPWSATTTWTVTGATGGQTVVLTANATQVGGGKDPGTDECCSGDITMVMPDCSKPVDVALTKTAGAAVYDEKTGLWTISFKIDVTNPGNPFAPGNSLSIDDPVPAGLNFVSGVGTNWSCASSAGNIHCGYNFGSGVFNTSAHLNQLVLTFTTKTPGKYQNCATVAVAAGSGFSESTLNNNKGCDTVEVKQNLDVAIAKTGVKVDTADLPVPGTTNFTYTLAITNVGPAFAGAGVITVTDVVPAGMTFTSVSGAPNWNCTPATVNAGNTLTCTYIGSGPAAAGASLGSITVNATAKGDGPWTNCADVAIAAATGADSNPGDNHSCVTLTAKGYIPVDPPPKQPTACGFDVIFVVDQSGSMAPYVSSVQGALNVAAGIFNHAPSQAALIRFSDSATLTYPMATSTYGNLNTGYSPAGETNWQAAMQQAYSLLPRTNTVIVFITDGDPNKYTDSNGVVQYTTNPLAAANAAIPVVNQIYAAGVPILGFGIGPNVSAANMSALLGSNFQMTPYSDLPGAMTTLAQQLCPGLYLTKSISPNSVNYYNNPSPPPVTVTLGLTNTAGTLNGVVVHDDLPIELTNPTGAVASLGAAAPGPAVSNVPPSSAQVIWTIPSLPAGSATLSYNATLSPNPVPTAGANWHYIHNYAQVSAVGSGGPVPNSTPGNMANIVSGPVHEPDEAHASVYVYNQGPPPPQYCVASSLWVVKTADDEACEIGGTCSFHVSVTASCSAYNQTGPAIAGFSGPVTFGEGVFPVPGSSTVSNSNLSITSAALPAGASMSSCTTNATWTPSSSLPSTCNANVTLPLNQTISFVVTMNSPGAVGPYKNCFLADGKPGHPTTGGFSPVYTDVNPPTSVTGGPWGDCASFNGETVHAAKPHCAAPLLPGPLAGQCFCPQGTVRRGNDCVPPIVCQPPSVRGPGDQCICPRGTVLIGNECVKPPACKPPMVPGPIPGQCICSPPGTVLVDGKCVRQDSCKPPMVPGPAGQCVCSPPGTVLVDGKCVRQDSCKPPMVPGPADQCICPPGTVQKGRECVKQPACTPPMIPGVPGGPACVCPPGTVQQGKECVKQTVCEPPHIVVGGHCVCPPGTVQQGKECVKQPVCEPPHILVGGQCVCPPGTVQQGKECVKQPVCEPPHILVGGQCVCPPGTLQKGKECVKQPVCPPPMIPGGPGAAQCVCPPGTAQEGRTCVKRPVCEPPARLNRRGECQCPEDMVAVGKTCVPRKREPPRATPAEPPRGRDNEPPRGGGRDNEPPRGGVRGNEPPHGGGRDIEPPRGGGPAPTELPGRR